jgi:hypothetical protein
METFWTKLHRFVSIKKIVKISCFISFRYRKYLIIKASFHFRFDIVDIARAGYSVKDAYVLIKSSVRFFKGSNSTLGEYACFVNRLLKLPSFSLSSNFL